MKAILMRSSLICMSCIVSSGSLLPQEEPVGDDEVILNTINTSGGTMRFVAVAQGTRWDSGGYLTSDYATSERSIYGDCDGCSPPEGWDLVCSSEYNDPVLAYGLYKIYHSSYPAEFFFYIDLVDDRACYAGENPDVIYTWDNNSKDWWWRRPGNPDTLIVEGQTLKLWEQCAWGGGYQSASKFQPTTPTNLTLTNSGGHPKLTWRRSDPRVSAKYKVYRGSTLITANAVSDTTYIDMQVSIGGGATTFYYKVRAVSGDGTKESPDFSNIVSTTGLYEDRPADLADGAHRRYRLESGYPNPFNPSTKLRFTMRERGYITLAVYNTVGQKVATLVEGEMARGSHEVIFDAGGLASGVYIARLSAGGTVQTMRMQFVR
jgi:hypothetical protein